MEPCGLQINKENISACVALTVGLLLIQVCFWLYFENMGGEKVELDGLENLPEANAMRLALLNKTKVPSVRSSILLQNLVASQVEMEGELAELRKTLAAQQRLAVQQAKLLETSASQMADLKGLLETSTAGTRLRGSNKNFTHDYITDGQTRVWDQRRFQKGGAYGFIKYSAYRLNASSVAVLGLGTTNHFDKRQLEGCEWSGAGGEKILGKLEALRTFEDHGLTYEAVVIICLLNEPVEESGGVLTAKIDHELMTLYSELAGEPLDPPDPLPQQLVYCSPPMYGHMAPERIREWLEYHLVYLQTDKFVFYDSGALGKLQMAMLEPYIKAGLVEVTDFREVVQYHTWVYAQGLAVLDCMYRHRFTATWVFMHDLDEFLEVSPPATLASLLSEHRDRPYLTHGCMVWATDRCRKEGEDEWDLAAPQERLVYRWPDFYCQDKNQNTSICLDHLGHRKYILNPRKVEMLSIHIIERPLGGGVDFPAEVMRHNHYRGLATLDKSQLCSKVTLTRAEEEVSEEQFWVRDESQVARAREIRRCSSNATQCPHD